MTTGSIWTPGAVVRPVDAPRVLRPRGDRRGFEPLSVASLPPPDRAPSRWRVGAAEGPIWTGRPVDRLLVDLSVGGLGDAIRQLAVLRGAVRCGRVGRPVVVCPPGASLAWLRSALAPVPVVEVDGAPEGPDAVLPPIHELPRLAWSRWPAGPLTALIAHLLELPLEALAGPCLNVDPRELAWVTRALSDAGWLGEPVVAVQTDTHPAARDLTQAWRAEKLPPALTTAIPHLVARGRFVLRVGAQPGGDAAGYGVVDLGGCSLSRMAAALFLADLALTGDSGPLHLAGAVGTPVAALFGPSDPAIHLCAAGGIPVGPPPTSCARIPCGAGSLLGGPLLPDHVTRVALPCPPEGGCLTRMPGEAVARAAEAVLAAIR